MLQTGALIFNVDKKPRGGPSKQIELFKFRFGELAQKWQSMPFVEGPERSKKVPKSEVNLTQNREIFFHRSNGCNLPFCYTKDDEVMSPSTVQTVTQVNVFCELLLKKL